MEVGALLRQARARQGLSQAQLAYRAGTTQQAVSRIERGAVSPSVETLEHLLAAMGEELVLESRPLDLPYEQEHFDRALSAPSTELLAQGLNWNRFAGRLRTAVREAWSARR